MNESKPVGQPSLRFIYFTDQVPRAADSGELASGGDLGEALKITIDPRLSPDPTDPVRFWLVVGLLGAFGGHHVECRLVDPDGNPLGSNTAISDPRYDEGWMWTSVHEMAFLPLRAGSYALQVFVDGDPIARKPLDVALEPAATPEHNSAEGVTSAAVEEKDDEFTRFKKMPLVGIPGIPQAKVMSLRFVAGDPRNNEGPEGRVGRYRVAFTLTRPGMRPSGEYQLAFERQMNGDSHLALGAPLGILETSPGAPAIVAKCLPNEHGFLGKILIEEIQAANFADAERRSYAIVNSALTNLGVLFDIPLHVFQCEVEEARTGKTKFTFVAPYSETPPLIEATFAGPSKELHACASFYREALVSTSVLYQYLCLFKVAESVTAVRTRAERSEPPPVWWTPEMRRRCLEEST